MPSLSVADVKPGSKIIKDVITPLGGVLFAKGKVLLPRDMEILQAFMIELVEIEGSDADHKTADSNKGSAKTASTKAVAIVKDKNSTPLHDEYDKMLALIKNSYRSVPAVTLPIYELRSQLEALVVHIKDYHVLKFVPRMLNEQDYNYHNAVLSALTSYKIAQWCNYPQKDWMQAAIAGLLHDIGNAKVDPSLLHKAEPLNSAEREEVRMHTTYGYQFLRNVTAINEGVRLTALQHHEKIDGSGYPLRLEGSQIHFYAKIVAVADIYHAMTRERAYRKAESPYLVLEQILKESFGKLDPVIVQTFLQKTTELYTGTKIRLSDGSIGEIIFTDRSNPTRPMVQVAGGRIVNLAMERELNIQEIIS
ncbi:HD-GYP domain-containing protein [Paenibacillus wynnii]|uniref:HD-GYP domain-containing protein n=1 Tax=Paenibacillus wynnii TaxID=268407 RepID=UPI00278EC100|nr:HD-GYP domain-containing protein [Paenibacillus wynnii]MDQ0193718.1 HD-GYP domain-containing protein (c-di-GMP phosphodiesterase class II) [Paenibacillus wynnii]